MIIFTQTTSTGCTLQKKSLFLNTAMPLAYPFKKQESEIILTRRLRCCKVKGDKDKGFWGKGGEGVGERLWDGGQMLEVSSERLRFLVKLGISPYTNFSL